MRDPNAKERARAEQEWAAQLAGILSDQYDELTTTMSSDRPYNPPPDWWEKWRLQIAAFLGLSLLQLAQLSAENEMATVGIGVDWAQVLAASRDWVSTYSFDLVGGINATSQTALQGLLSDYYAGKIDFDTMTAMLESQFGPTRAAMIARTEVTRAFVQGQSIYNDELNSLGLDTDRQWHTTDTPCPLCEPYDGVFESEGWDDGEPPLHPNDQCFTTIEILPGSKMYREWREKANAAL